VPEHADSLEVAVGAVLEFDTNEVAEFRCGTAEELECQCRGVVGYIYVEVVLDTLLEENDRDTYGCRRGRVSSPTHPSCGRGR